MKWSRETQTLVDRYCWYCSSNYPTPKGVVYMGVAYARKHSLERTGQSRIFAINTWTIVPMPAKVTVGYPDGKL